MQYSLDKVIRKKKYTYKKKRKIKHKKKHKTYKRKHKTYKTKPFHKYKKKTFKKSLKKYKKKLKGGFILKNGDSMLPFFTDLGHNISTTSTNTICNIQGKPPIPTANPVDQPLFKVDTAEISTPASVNYIYNNAVNSVNTP